VPQILGLRRHHLCYNTGVGTLFVVATPIGNLEDITLRALRILGEVALIAAEDTRHSGQLLSHYDIHTPLTSYHDHSNPQKREKILQALAGGDVALISDAGTPGLNDPGYPLVSAAIAAGHCIVPIPGPSAPIAALTASGLATDSFVFLGYVPRKHSDREALFETLKVETRTTIFFEAPNRILATVEHLQDVLGQDRSLVLCRELTKMYEEFVRGKINEVLAHLREGGPRGEYTLILGGAPEIEPWSEAEVRIAFERELEGGASRTEAARIVAALSGWPRKRIYRMGLEEA
jgi:16S rRNA (cytidine1402-2'-O)-methyltransferase